MIVSGVPKMKTGEEFGRENWASQESYYIGVDIVPFTHKEKVRGGWGGGGISVKLNWINRFSGPGTWNFFLLVYYYIVKVAFRVVNRVHL